jgi:hypothetical protein
MAATTTKIGFVGLGHMGGNMAARFLAAGYTVLLGALIGGALVLKVDNPAPLALATGLLAAISFFSHRPLDRRPRRHSPARRQPGLGSVAGRTAQFGTPRPLARS